MSSSASWSSLTSDADAAALLASEPFAVLLGALFDHGIVAERAWAAPRVLQQRLGHLDLARIVAEPDQVRAAVAGPPGLHRYVEALAGWVVEAARIVLTEYGGDASALWSGQPTKAELEARLRAFPGFGQVKAAKAVQVLETQLGVSLRAAPDAEVA